MKLHPAGYAKVAKLEIIISLGALQAKKFSGKVDKATTHHDKERRLFFQGPVSKCTADPFLLMLSTLSLFFWAPGCSCAAPGLLSQKHEQPATTNNLRQFGLLRWGVRVVVSTRRSERWVRLHTIASISSRDLVLGVSAERGVPEAVRASIAKLNINIT